MFKVVIHSNVKDLCTALLVAFVHYYIDPLKCCQNIRLDPMIKSLTKLITLIHFISYQKCLLL